MGRERSGAISRYAGESHHARASAILEAEHPDMSGPAALLHLVAGGLDEVASAVRFEGGGEPFDVLGDLRVRGLPSAGR